MQADIGDCAPQFAEFVLDRVDQRVDGSRVAQVSGPGPDIVVPEFTRETGPFLFQPVLAARGQRDLCALCQTGFHNAKSDAPARAGDKDGFSLQTQIHERVSLFAFARQTSCARGKENPRP